MQISPAANTPTAAIDTEGMPSRYEALTRLAELIRSHPEEKDLFQTYARERHQVVALDAISQFDSAANCVQWHFLEPYNSEFEVFALKALPREETVAWWV
jgi:formate hydrogenlyase transcriptional activator